MAHVLIVEDNDLQQSLYRGLFNRMSVELTQVGTTSGAHEAIRNRNFDLIIMDIMLPDGSGVDAMRQIRQLHEYEKTPIIIVSTQVTPVQKEMLFEAGATTCLAKPVDFAVIANVLGDHLKTDT